MHLNTRMDVKKQKKEKQQEQEKQQDQDDSMERVDQTIAEAIIICLVILTLGLYLLIHKSRTNKSYIHRIFEPIDRIMYDSTLDYKYQLRK